jgi:hypothetical protein
MSEPNPVVASLNLEQLRKQARELLRQAHSGQLTRVLAHPPLADRQAHTVKLADCQFVIARELGFASWAKLKHGIELLDRTRFENAAALVEAALDQDLPRARALLAADPSLAHHDLSTALVCGEAQSAADELESEPDAWKAGLSKRLMPAIFLCTRSGLVRHEPQRDFVGCVRLLAARGADVNTHFPFDAPYAQSTGTPLYYAAGVHNHKPLTRALLALGATPNDGETLYHSVERRDAELLRIVFTESSGGVDRAQWSYAFIHLLDQEWPEGVRTMLALGNLDLAHAHPTTGERALHWAVKRVRSAEVFRILLEAGADPLLPDHQGVTAYALAARCGHTQALAEMHARGHRPDLTPIDQLLLAASANDRTTCDRLKRDHPGLVASMTDNDRRALIRAAEHGRAHAVEGLITLAEISPATLDEWGATALHHACLHAHADVVATLIRLSAPLDAQDRSHSAYPIGWACWGSENEPFSSRDHIPIVHLLLDAGGPKPTALWGSPAVQAALRARGVS